MSACRNCALYDLDAAKNAAGAVLKRRSAECLWKSTETWPVSVTPSMNRRPEPSYMQPDDGARCGRFIKRTPA